MTCLKLSDAEARLCHQSNDGDLLERFDQNVQKLVFKDIDGLTGFLTGSSGFGSSHETDFGSSLILSKFWMND